jgi:hypothetical protein
LTPSAGTAPATCGPNTGPQPGQDGRCPKRRLGRLRLSGEGGVGAAASSKASSAPLRHGGGGRLDSQPVGEHRDRCLATVLVAKQQEGWLAVLAEVADEQRGRATVADRFPEPGDLQQQPPLRGTVAQLVPLAQHLLELDKHVLRRPATRRQRHGDMR